MGDKKYKEKHIRNGLCRNDRNPLYSKTRCKVCLDKDRVSNAFRSEDFRVKSGYYATLQQIMQVI